MKIMTVIMKTMKAIIKMKTDKMKTLIVKI